MKEFQGETGEEATELAGQKNDSREGIRLVPSGQERDKEDLS